MDERLAQALQYVLHDPADVGTVRDAGENDVEFVAAEAGDRVPCPHRIGRVEKRYRKPDGTIVWCAVDVSWIRGEDG